MALIKLLADPDDDDTLPPPPPKLAGADFPIADLLLELREERRKAKHREAAFLSVLAHLALIVLLLLGPKLFGTAPVRLRPVSQRQPQQLTYLELPRSLIKRQPKPAHPRALSDQNRTVPHPAPPTNSVAAPVTRPTRRPLMGTGQPNPPAPTPAPPPRPAPAPQTAAAAPSASPAPKSANNSPLQLENVPAATPHPNLHLNLGAAEQLDRAIAGAARDRGRGSPAISETAPLPNQSPLGGSSSAAPGETGAGVQILTNTEGVDFDPYLRQVVDIVRRNWYAVMPETVYLGTKGRVVVVFNINRDGSVPGLHPVRLAGTASLNEAAEASITASNPFPPLPSQFRGPFITLEFSFFYNLTPPGN